MPSLFRIQAKVTSIVLQVVPLSEITWLNFVPYLVTRSGALGWRCMQRSQPGQSFTLCTGDKFLKILQRQGFAEKISLIGMAAMVCEQFHLRPTFHAFGDDS